MIVAFEGIDACGKQTQTAKLLAYADEKGIETTVLSFPCYKTEVGAKISQMLRMPDDRRDPLVLQSLMTINRFEKQQEISSAQSKGELVILDRYWMSGWVYGQTDNISPHWLETTHSALIQPHQTIILDITVEESFKRRLDREDAYERNTNRLKKARGLYLEASARSIFSPCTVLNGSMPSDEIHAAIVRCCEL